MDHMINVIQNQRSGLLEYDCKEDWADTHEEDFLSPIPTQNLLIVHSKLVGEIQIFNPLGQLVMMKYKPVSQDTELDVSGLENGVYFMKLGDWGSRFWVEK